MKRGASAMITSAASATISERKARIMVLRFQGNIHRLNRYESRIRFHRSRLRECQRLPIGKRQARKARKAERESLRRLAIQCDAATRRDSVNDIFQSLRRCFDSHEIDSFRLDLVGLDLVGFGLRPIFILLRCFKT